MVSNYELVVRLVLSAVIGGLIGMEREANNRPAGLRTHVLVTLGAALIMLLSTNGFQGINGNGDPARLAAQVVSGIGFLGAGTILRTGNSVKGLTTAASIWVCGGIGLAIGGGYYLGGLVTAAIVLFSLISLGMLEKRYLTKQYRVLIVQCRERAGLIGDIGQLFGKYNATIKDIKIYQNPDEDDLVDESDAQMSENLIEIHFVLKLPKNFNEKVFYKETTQVHGVEQVTWN